MEVSWLLPCTRIPLLLLSLAGVWGSQSNTPTPAPLYTPCSFYTGKTCEECLKNVSCLWCTTNNSCLDYPVKKILPPSSLCALSNARWAACWINFEALIIAISVVLGIILLGIVICCCYCCYCRKRSNARQLEAEEENLIRERERRKHESMQRYVLRFTFYTTAL
ncbi:pituitary tumor-transforming gene 1 protein-interacting protein-like [Mantella aurantiaca]